MIKRHFAIQVQAIEDTVNSEVFGIIKINVSEQKYIKSTADQKNGISYLKLRGGVSRNLYQ